MDAWSLEKLTADLVSDKSFFAHAARLDYSWSNTTKCCCTTIFITWIIVISVNFIIGAVQTRTLSKGNTITMLITDKSFITLTSWLTGGITDTSSRIGNKASRFHALISAFLVCFICQTVPVRTDAFLDAFTFWNIVRVTTDGLSVRKSQSL